MKKFSLDFKNSVALKVRPASNGVKEKCREDKCNSPVPQGKSWIARICRLLHLCRYCYRMKFPEPAPINLPACRRGSQRIFTPWERQQIERRSFGYLDNSKEMPPINEYSPIFAFEQMEEPGWTPESYDAFMGVWGETKSRRKAGRNRRG